MPTANSPDQPDRRGLWLGLFALAFIAQSVVLYWPSPPGSLPSGPAGADKLIHLLVFAIPAAIAVMAGLRPWVVAILLLVQAGISEIVQGTFLADRGADPWDFAADLIGIVLGIFVGFSASRWLGRSGVT